MLGILRQKAVGDGPIVANHAYGPPHDLMLKGSVTFAMDEFWTANKANIEIMIQTAALGQYIYIYIYIYIFVFLKKPH